MPTALVLLDLSAAFDTIDHRVLLNWLSSWFSLCGVVLDWFVFNLADRNQCVKVGDVLSDPADLIYNVPQEINWTYIYRWLNICVANHVTEEEVQAHSWCKLKVIYNIATLNWLESLRIVPRADWYPTNEHQEIFTRRHRIQLWVFS